MKKICLLAVFLLLMLLLAGCTRGSGTVKNGSELNTPTKMSRIYDQFNGYKETQVTVKEGKPVIVSVGIVTQSGSLDAYIAKDNKLQNASYEGHDIPTSSFTVTLSEPGSYTVRVDAQNHSGSYSFSWKEAE